MKKKNQKKEDLLDSAQRLKALMNALPVGVTFSADTTCEYITGNPYLLEKLEMDQAGNISADMSENGMGKKLKHFINGRQITGAEMPMQRAIAENRQIGPLEIEVELPSGKRWLMEAIGAPVHDEKGKIIASIAVNIDLNERKKAGEAITLRKQVEEDKKKNEFIADATHEFRTPLAIIKGNVDLALNSEYDKDAINKTLRAINAEVVHLSKLLGDLTLLTTQGHEFLGKMSTHKIQLHDFISGIIERHQAFAKKKRVTLHLGKLPKVNLFGDERYLERLFSNIISNAILYDRAGGSVWVSAKKINNQIHIAIRDNGIGISKENLTNIFNRFYRAESSRSKATGGTGLGLAIVKWIAEAHGGTVAVSSRENMGSTFTVILPFEGQ
jgi:signal transduction histidine kinase